ncbi:hypothetical protein N7G274_004333 [Stereocaulon virgatum]|uniref:C2H2-type domain-containing protein n=1 Tax=Stereocaulon virgatum TaxID=373712 RepID=A0ABR4ACZ3_9LECA
MSNTVFPSLKRSYGLYSLPDPDQTKAANALKNCSDREIVSWLAFARKGGFGARPRTWNLPVEIVEAFSKLVDSGDELILGWVQEARACTQSVAKLEKAAIYWCTICGTDKLKPYKNHDEWRREEKQHEATYICMFGETSGVPGNGFNCTRCLAPNPEGCQHHVQACLAPSGDRFSCKRRYDMVRHLKKVHGVDSKAEGEAMAGKWKQTLDKSAWACGFCLTTFSNFQDRLRHLQLHFEQGKTMDNWSTTLVIQGLLQQPSILEAWKAKLVDVLPGSETWQFVWKEPTVKELQYRLEMGPSQSGESAETLVETAFKACDFDWALPEESEHFGGSGYRYAY